MEIKELFNILEKLAPSVSAVDFFNHQPTDLTKSVFKLGVCVDPTPENISRAVQQGIEILISYHPWQGEAELMVRNQEMEIWSLHEAWDKPVEGVIFSITEAIGLTGLYSKGEISFGEAQIPFRELIERCQRVLDLKLLPFYGDLKQIASKIAIWSGPGFFPNYKKFWEMCLVEACDTMISTELTLSALRYARAHQLKLIDLGHSAMAKPAMLRLAELLRNDFNDRDCTVDFFSDIYTCNYYTNCSFAEQFQETEDDLVPFF